MPYGDERFDYGDQLLKEAEALGDVSLLLDATEGLVESALFAGYPLRMLQAFDRHLALTEETRPGRYGFTLLWMIKWVTSHLVLFPQVSRQELESRFATCFEIYRRARTSLRPLHLIRAETAVAMGDLQLGSEQFGLYKRAPRDGVASCPPCERDQELGILLELGRWSEAQRVAKRLFGGSQRCGEVPDRSHALMLLPLLERGDRQRAAHHDLEGYRAIRNKRMHTSSLAAHVTYTVLTGTVHHAARRLARPLAWAVETYDLHARLEVFLSMRLLLQRAVNEGRESIALALPPGFSPHGDGACVPSEALGRLEGKLDYLVAAFDARNGNSLYRDYVRGRCDLLAA